MVFTLFNQKLYPQIYANFYFCSVIELIISHNSLMYISIYGMANSYIHVKMDNNGTVSFQKNNNLLIFHFQ